MKHNLAIIDYALKRSLNETKIYFFDKSEGVFNENYHFFERIMAFLYKHIFYAKKADFLFKTGIFFPFLFRKSIEEILKSQSYDVIFERNSLKNQYFCKKRLFIYQKTIKFPLIQIKLIEFQFKIMFFPRKRSIP